MVFLEKEKFLSSMSRMFQSNREGTVRMSVKPYDGQDRPTPKDGSKAKWNKEKLVLIRVCEIESEEIFPNFLTYIYMFSRALLLSIKVISSI